ncbi:MAG: CRISPR-associated endonuclease Cas1 [Bacteroidota bacterium]|nr:CRISPR-associated endonuclease Cas1 [Bacteroidota bacterium]
MSSTITQTLTLYEGIASLENLNAGWRKVEDNDGAAGIDGVSILNFGFNAHERLLALHDLLEEKKYMPQPLLTFNKTKESGGVRMLSIPTVSDRVVQASALFVLNPIIDPLFSDASFAFRKGISRLDAAEQIEAFRKDGFRYVVDADIEQFFDNVDHTVLLKRCEQIIHDAGVVQLIRLWIEADALVEGVRTKRAKGLPQGAVISPLLANLYLDQFDEALQRMGNKLVRFADDFVILCKTKPQAEQALELTEDILAALKLKLHAEKTRITSFDEGFRYLGYLFVKSLVLPSKKPSSPERDAMLQLVQSAKEILEKEASAGSIAPAGKADAEEPAAPPPPPAFSPFLRTLYVQDQGTTLRRESERLIVQKGEKEVLDVQAIKVEQIFIFGACMITPAAMRFCLMREIPITMLSNTGEYYGRIEATTKDHSFVQRMQALRVLDSEFVLATAKAIVRGKIENSVDVLQRQHRKSHRIVLTEAIHALRTIQRKLDDAKSLDQLLGYEGTAAARYFDAFSTMLLNSDFHFSKRTRQPPQDRMNSLLSFFYTLLFYNVYSLAQAYGLNPFWGVLHRDKRNHPSLVSDLIEEFRCVVESAAIYMVNNKMIRRTDFYENKTSGIPFLLNDAARRKVLRVFEEAMQQTTLHVDSGRSMSIRRCIEAQVRMLVQVILSERPVYVPFRRGG